MDNELYHHGVKGQKWGVRRYQNKDGSLTYAGKKKALKMQDRYTNFTENKRYRKRDGSYTLKGRKKALKMKEKYSELTGKDLKRFPKVEKKPVIDINKKMSELDPKKVSKGKQFIKYVSKEMILPAATDVGKQIFKSMMTKAANKAFNFDDELKVYTNNKKK